VKRLRLAACCAILASGLAGCVSRGALVAPSLSAEASRSVELVDTPFFPQRKLQCGPASLATILGASHVPVTPDELEPLVYSPQRRGSLQVEMQATPRRFARLPYPIGRNLSDILAELDGGRPVLVLHNYGLPFLPRWHYAVAIGYDAERDSMLLRSGTTRRQVLSAANFMRAWDNGGRWAMVVLVPGEMPAAPDRNRYLESAAAFEHSAQPRDARLVFDAAVKLWPDEPIALIGRGTASYRAGDLPAAADDYSTALRLDPAQNGARNNLAMTLLDLKCGDEAREQLAQIDVGKLEGPLAAAVRDTQKQIEAAAPHGGTGERCGYQAR
jgi:tetratricopeptide (TPR) repeat protein